MVDGTTKTKKVGLFATANAADSERIARGVELFQQMTAMEVLPWQETPQGPRHFAGDDQIRAKSFNALLDEPCLEGLVAMRGGYGTTRVLASIDFEKLYIKNCFICGYSDITSLLRAAWKFGCKRLIHGPMMHSSWGANLSEEIHFQEAASFLEVLNGQPNLLPPWAGGNVLKAGTAAGPLIVMNLTLLTALLGTPFFPDLAGTILALEDISEPAHDIDRKLNQLHQVGILKQIHGLLFGKFTDSEDAEFLPEIRREYTSLVNGPVVEELSLGHCHPSISLPFGAVVQLVATADGLFELRRS